MKPDLASIEITPFFKRYAWKENTPVKEKRESIQTMAGHLALVKYPGLPEETYAFGLIELGTDNYFILLQNDFSSGIEVPRVVEYSTLEEAIVENR